MNILWKRDRYLLGGLYRVFSHYFSDKISSNCLGNIIKH